MVTRVTEKALKPASVTSNQPLNFEFYYGSSAAPTEMNTVYLDDGNAKVDLNLVVFNESSKTITFVQTPSGNPSGEKFASTSPNSANEANGARCHFSVTFAKDLNIKPAEIELQDEQRNDWQVNYDEDEQFTTIYFLKKQRLVLQAKDPKNTSHRILLTFKNFAARNGFVKTSNVKLTYGSDLLLDGQNRPFTNSITVNNAISVTNHPENKNILLQVRCVGPNTILNDGTSQNSLKLQIINRSLSANRPNLLLDKANSMFIVSFETDTDNAATNGTLKAEAVTTLAKSNNVSITSAPSTTWKVDKTPSKAEWTVKLQDNSTKTILGDRETIELNISNLVTSNPSGVAYLYITYKNIGTYPDGQLVVPIEKTPLLYRNTQVGIGTISPSAKLHVSGGDAIISDKIGIGTTSPSAKLHVQGGDAIVSGNVGIGITTPSVKLHVNGNIRLSGDIQNGANGRVNLYTNTSASNSDAWIELWGSQNTDSTRIGELALTGKYIDFRYNSTQSGEGTVGMRLTSDGNVGIGTTSPSAKLHVKGRIKDKTGWVMPVGTILPYAGATAPEGWLLCDGASRSKSEYGDLFEVIQYKYGGSGNNFNLPNLKGRVPVGFSNEEDFNTLGKTGGDKTITLTIDQMPSHKHDIDDPGHYHILPFHNGSGQGRIDDAGEGFRSNGSTERSWTAITIKNQGGSLPHNNLQPYLTVNYIIKY